MITFCIITCTYNAAHELPRTLDSVRRQSYAYVTHLIIDGQSGDDTVAMAHDYADRCHNEGSRHEVNVVSERDNGLYDAMNKGLRMATGDYVVFLNAGDALADDTTLERIARQLLRRGDALLPAVVYGDTDLIDGEGNVTGRRRLQPPNHLTWRSFINGMLVCHQAFYARTDIARQMPYDRHYRFSADVDWCIRVMKEGEQQGLEIHNTHLTLCHYLAEGMTTRNHRKSLFERFHVMRRHYGLLRTIIAHISFLFR